MAGFFGFPKLDFDDVIRWFWIPVVWFCVPIWPMEGQDSSGPPGIGGTSDVGGLSGAVSTIRETFGRLDSNGDFQIDADEFGSIHDDARVGRRDFQLFDLDQNGRLSRDEFASVSGLVAPPLRGTMADPLDRLVDDAVAALDESYDHWNRRPDELIGAHTFVSSFLDSISPGEKRFVTGRIIGQADLDTDGRISRAEARLFLEQQLGMRLQHGPPLREPTGRLVRYDRFLAMDRDRDASLTRQEFMRTWPEDSPIEKSFDEVDRDRNDRISYDEYAHSDSGIYFDPIEWFRQADQDLDAKLSEEELTKSIERERLHLVESTMKSFDNDRDGMLSLDEYRSSMLGSYNYPWARQPLDRDRDGQLSYDEFVFDSSDLFQLQRWYYFHRFDLDGDGMLSPDEFGFQARRPVSIWAYSVSGSSSRMLYQSHEFPDCGWPSVSPDGSQLLFHECPPSGTSEGRIVVVSLDGSHMRVICDGIQPSWSADGESFVCERQSRNAGIWLMDAGGRSGRRVSAGTGPKWSPDGKSIAFLNDNGVSIFDVTSGAIRRILQREDHPYQDLGGDIAWSPDGSQLAVMGNFTSTCQLLILPVPDSGLTTPRIRYSFDVGFRGNLNWSDKDGILLGMHDVESGETQLISLDPDSDQAPSRAERFVGLAGTKSACVTRDQNWYIVVVDD